MTVLKAGFAGNSETSYGFGSALNSKLGIFSVGNVQIDWPDRVEGRFCEEFENILCIWFRGKLKNSKLQNRSVGNTQIDWPDRAKGEEAKAGFATNQEISYELGALENSKIQTSKFEIVMCESSSSSSSPLLVFNDVAHYFISPTFDSNNSPWEPAIASVSNIFLYEIFLVNYAKYPKYI